MSARQIENDQQAKLHFWTRAQLAFCRREFSEAGAFREDETTFGKAHGAFGANLSYDERAALRRVEWSRVAETLMFIVNPELTTEGRGV